MKFSKYDIVLIDFPFSDLTRLKKRPALILRNLEGQNNIICQITTKRRKITKYEIEVKKTDCDGDIRFDSAIYVDMLFTLHESLIYRKIGSVKNEKIRAQIEDKLKILFF